MPEAGCLCGELRVAYTQEPKAQVLCHCKDCRKISGSAFSTNYLVPTDDFKTIKGTPKQYAKTADSGETITSFFCGNCGSVVYRESPSFEGSIIFKAGTLDEQENLAQMKPGLELFSKNRVGFVNEISGAAQK